MKKISAVFDGLKFSESTLAYGIKLAQSSKSLLSGVFLESFRYHSYEPADLIGAHGLSSVKAEHFTEKDKESRLKSAAIFERSCQSAKIDHSINHDPGFALDEIIRESIYSDLLVIYADETLSHLHEHAPTQFIRELLAGTQCPVLVTPRVFREIDQVVLLYDGKPSSVYAIKLFNYLMPWLSIKPTEIISVTGSRDLTALPDEHLVKEFITCHYPNASYTLLNGDPEDELVSYLKNTSKNCLVVVGAYHRSNVSRWFQSSMADRLIKDVDMPLFIAHH